MITQDEPSIELQFLSELLNERDTLKEGYSMPVRWLCLRDDLRKKYLQEARQLIDTWWTDEQIAKKSRETNTPYPL